MKEYLKKFELTACFLAFGFYWFTPFLVLSNGYDSDTPNLFLGTYFFLPGIALPLLVYFIYRRNYSINVFFYVFLSWMIYVISIWIFSYARFWVGLPYVSSFIGALLFILVSNKLVAKRFGLSTSIIGGILSTIGFIFGNLLPDKLGFSFQFFCWTFFVGLIINLKIEYSYSNSSHKKE